MPSVVHCILAATVLGLPVLRVFLVREQSRGTQGSCTYLCSGCEGFNL